MELTKNDDLGSFKVIRKKSNKESDLIMNQEIKK